MRFGSARFSIATRELVPCRYVRPTYSEISFVVLMKTLACRESEQSSLIYVTVQLLTLAFKLHLSGDRLIESTTPISMMRCVCGFLHMSAGLFRCCRLCALVQIIRLITQRYKKDSINLKMLKRQYFIWVFRASKAATLSQSYYSVVSSMQTRILN
jgi:hypothetical protein